MNKIVDARDIDCPGLDTIIDGDILITGTPFNPTYYLCIVANNGGFIFEQILICIGD